MNHRITILPNALHFECADDERITDAAEREGIRFPVSCRNGVCHICRAALQKGRVEQLGAQVSTVYAPAEIFVCHARPQEEITLYMDGVYGPAELPMNQFQCQIKSVAEMQGHVYRVILEQPAGKLKQFFAGQYLALNLPNRDEDTYFSIASAPGHREIELHIQADPHLEKAVETVDFLRSSPSVSVKLPFGKACLPSVPESPVLLLAAGTGFAQMKSLIEYLLENDFNKELSLYWTARKESDLYAVAWLDALADKHENFQIQTIVANESEQETTQHHSLLADAVLEGHSSLKGYMAFVAGSPRMVYSSMDALEEAGLEDASFYSDVLEYVSRDQI